MKSRRIDGRVAAAPKMLSFMLGGCVSGGGRRRPVRSTSAPIGPDVFQVSRTYDIPMIVMGGMGSISGSVLAAFIVTIGQEWLRVLDSPLSFLPFWPESGVSGMRMVVFSILLLIVILFSATACSATTRSHGVPSAIVPGRSAAIAGR